MSRIVSWPFCAHACANSHITTNRATKNTQLLFRSISRTRILFPKSTLFAESFGNFSFLWGFLTHRRTWGSNLLRDLVWWNDFEHIQYSSDVIFHGVSYILQLTWNKVTQRIGFQRPQGQTRTRGNSSGLHPHPSPSKTQIHAPSFAAHFLC